MRKLTLAITAALLTVTGIAASHENGIIGYSGKSGGTFCTSCHNQPGDVPAPTVSLTGPTALDAGASAVYTFTVTTTQPSTGMNAAATDGTSLSAVDGGNTRDEEGEVTHPNPIAVTAGSTTYKFALTAPAYGGTISLYAAGNAVDNSGDNTGDNAAKTKIDITINGPPAPEPDASTTVPPSPLPPPPPPPPPPPASAADAGTTTPAANGATGSDDSGCNVADGSSSVPGGAALAALVALVALRRKRR